MRTPFGKECRYFYGDYFRGRQHEECRLLDQPNIPPRWKPALCGTCPVPDIILANECSHMVLSGELYRPFPFLKKAVRVRASCTKTLRDVAEPHIGCGKCHPLPEVFQTAPEPPPQPPTPAEPEPDVP